MKLYVVALLMFIAPVVHADFPEKHFNPNMASVDQWYCESKDDEIVNLSNSLKPSDEFYMAAKIASIMKEKQSNQEKIRLERKIGQNGSLSQEDRIIYAFTLLKTKVTDFRKN